uniref:Uncharacterized protein n=1 Tax=Cacopsylla melanoneura TaxID=428564 RepID=A0A8D8Z8T8_9HEMI
MGIKIDATPGRLNLISLFPQSIREIINNVNVWRMCVCEFCVYHCLSVPGSPYSCLTWAAQWVVPNGPPTPLVYLLPLLEIARCGSMISMLTNTILYVVSK